MTDGVLRDTHLLGAWELGRIIARYGTVPVPSEGQQFSVSAAKAARDLASATLKGKQAELNLAQKDLDRTQQLFTKGNVARAPLDRAEAEVTALAAARDTAAAALRQREFEVSVAEASLSLPSDSPRASSRCCFAIRAPITGQVLRLVQENEGVVQIAQPLAEVGDST